MQTYLELMAVPPLPLFAAHLSILAFGLALGGKLGVERYKANERRHEARIREECRRRYGREPQYIDTYAPSVQVITRSSEDVDPVVNGFLRGWRNGRISLN